MARLVAILVTLILVAIPAKADVALWPEPVPGWTVIQIYGEIKVWDLADFQRYTENVDPAATLVIVTGPGGHLLTGLGIGARVHDKKLIVGAMGLCSSSCALIWIAGETGRKFLYQDQPPMGATDCPDSSDIGNAKDCPGFSDISSIPLPNLSTWYPEWWTSEIIPGVAPHPIDIANGEADSPEWLAASEELPAPTMSLAEIRASLGYRQ
jgi:hypothetical protein